MKNEVRFGGTREEGTGEHAGQPAGAQDFQGNLGIVVVSCERGAPREEPQIEHRVALTEIRSGRMMGGLFSWLPIRSLMERLAPGRHPRKRWLTCIRPAARCSRLYSLKDIRSLSRPWLPLLRSDSSAVAMALTG